jgi:hypothetical protein
LWNPIPGSGIAAHSGAENSDLSHAMLGSDLEDFLVFFLEYSIDSHEPVSPSRALPTVVLTQSSKQTLPFFVVLYQDDGYWRLCRADRFLG